MSANTPWLALSDAVGGSDEAQIFGASGTSRPWPTLEKVSFASASAVTGVFVAAGFCTFTPVLGPEIRQAMLEVSQHAIDFGWWELLFRGITAGFLIAALTWLIPSAKGTEFFVILLMTYLIALFHSAHVVAGGADVFMLGMAGQLSSGNILGGFILPALIGNVVGGTGLFALLAYAQVKEEL